MQTLLSFTNKQPGRMTIFIINVLIVVTFSLVFLLQKNTEFLIYVGTIIIFQLLILFTDKKVHYPNTILWLLSVWSLMHVCGGGIVVQGAVLYQFILIKMPVSLPILRYDQIVHLFGFGSVTLLLAHILSPLLKNTDNNHTRYGILIIMAGMGVGALNEIIEFTLTVLLPNTNVGGYINTSLDLVFNGVGAVLAFAYLTYKNSNRQA